eukprot:SAG31_NODE_4023_length_3657_cov_2.633783_1_plen_1041_part_00
MGALLTKVASIASSLARPQGKAGAAVLATAILLAALAGLLRRLRGKGGEKTTNETVSVLQEKISSKTSQQQQQQQQQQTSLGWHCEKCKRLNRPTQKYRCFKCKAQRPMAPGAEKVSDSSSPAGDGDDGSAAWLRKTDREKRAWINAQIAAFKNSSDEGRAFPTALDKKWRREVHAAAERNRLGAESTGEEGSSRHIVVTKSGWAPSPPWAPYPNFERMQAVALGDWPVGEGAEKAALEARTVFKGRLSINRKRRTLAYVTVARRPEGDLVISNEKQRNRALDGDIVAFNLIRGRQRETIGHRTKGRQSVHREGAIEANVLCVLERNCRTQLAGSVMPPCFGEQKFGMERGTVLFEPLDGRYPYVELPPDLLPPVCEQMLLSVELALPWDHTHKFPLAAAVELLGPVESLQSHLAAAIVDARVSLAEPTDEVKAEVDRIVAEQTRNQKVADARRDYTDVCAFCIDPATARDLDDALHCNALDDGTFEVGVHIADLGHYIVPGSELAAHAAARATTTYLKSSNYPMVPRKLSDEICSLHGGQEKFCFSVVLRLDSNGVLLDNDTDMSGDSGLQQRQMKLPNPPNPYPYPWFGKTLIKPRGKLSYEDAQAVIAGHGVSAVLESKELVMKEEADKVVQGVLHLNCLARSIRARRLAATGGGAHSSGNFDPEFYLCGEEMVRMETEQTENQGSNDQASHELVEEFMLLANKLVAEKLVSTAPQQTLLKQHAKPQTSRLVDWCGRCSERGFSPDAVKNLGKPDQTNVFAFADAAASELSTLLNDHDAPADRRAAAAALLMQLMRCNQKSKYICAGDFPEAERFHYGLGMPLYTHFTSPIRRFADLVVHWQLAAVLQGKKCDDMPLNADDVSACCLSINVLSERASSAQRQSNNICRCRYIAQAGAQGLEETAVVVGLGEKWLELLIPRLGLDRVQLHCETITEPSVWKAKGPNGTGSLHIFVGRAANAEEGGYEIVVEDLSCIRVRLCCTFDSAKPSIVVRYVPPLSEAVADPNSPMARELAHTASNELCRALSRSLSSGARAEV